MYHQTTFFRKNSYLDTETRNQTEVITSAEKIFTKAANIAETIPVNQN